MKDLMRIEKGQVVTDSRFVAEQTGKEHKNVIADIRDELQKLGETGELIFQPSSYKNSQNKMQPCYTLNEEGLMQIMARYDAVVRRKIILKIKELRDQIEHPRELREPSKPSVATLNQTAKILMAAYENAGVSKEYQVLALDCLYASSGLNLPKLPLTVETHYFENGEIAKRLGVYSQNGLPHAHAIGALIAELGVPESETKIVPYVRNGHSGTTTQYSENVVQMVKKALDDWGRPKTLSLKKKQYVVQYS